MNFLRNQLDKIKPNFEKENMSHAKVPYKLLIQILFLTPTPQH